MEANNKTSQVFQAMFNHPLTELVNNRVEMNDVDGDVLWELLRYIYTAKFVKMETDLHGKFLVIHKWV